MREKEKGVFFIVCRAANDHQNHYSHARETFLAKIQVSGETSLVIHMKSLKFLCYTHDLELFRHKCDDLYYVLEFVCNYDELYAYLVSSVCEYYLFWLDSSIRSLI